MGKFCQIITVLLPLIYVKIGFHALFWAFFWQIIIKLFIPVDIIWEEWFGIVDG